MIDYEKELKSRLSELNKNENFQFDIHVLILLSILERLKNLDWKNND